MRHGRTHCIGHRQPSWLRWLVATMLFSALQSVLGAVAVSTLSDEAMVEVCTVQGMHWMTQAEAEQAGLVGPGADEGVGARGLAQPCAWALAHVSVPPAVQADRRAVPPLPAQVGPLCPESPRTLLPCAAERILLMAPMRAPPAPAV